MTSVKEADQGKEASVSIVSKSRSPSKDKSSSAPGSDAPTRTSKKRRKVNHGKTSMLCLVISLTVLLTFMIPISMHILQTFGKPQPSS